MKKNNYILLTDCDSKDSVIKKLTSLVNKNKNKCKVISILSGKNKKNKFISPKNNNAFAIVYCNKSTLDFGSDIVLELRKKAITIPVLLLTWLNPQKFWVERYSTNIFLSPYFNKSCKILRLPFNIDEFKQSIDELEPITKQDLIKGIFFHLESDLNHQLISVKDFDTIKKNIFDFIELINKKLSLRKNEHINQLINEIRNCNSITSIIEKLNLFKYKIPEYINR